MVDNGFIIGVGIGLALAAFALAILYLGLYRPTRRRRDRFFYSELLTALSLPVLAFDRKDRLFFHNKSFSYLWSSIEKSFYQKAPRLQTIWQKLYQTDLLETDLTETQFVANQMALAQKGHGIHDYLLRLKNGQQIHLLYTRTPSGKLIVLFDDITAQIDLLRSFQKAQDYQKQALGNLHEAVTIFDQNGLLKSYNQAFVFMWEFEDPKMLDGRPSFAAVMEAKKVLFPPTENWEKFKDKIQKRMLGGAHKGGQMFRNDGRVIRYSSIPLPMGETMMIYHDVSDYYRAERALRERNQALESVDHLKTSFLKKVSQDLLAPIDQIVQIGQALHGEEAGSLTPKQKEYLESMVLAAKNMSYQMEDVVDLASLEAGKMNLQLREFDFAEVLSSILPILKQRADRHQISWEEDIVKDLPTVYLDELRIRQLLYYLLTGAMKFAEKGAAMKSKLSFDQEAMRPLQFSFSVSRLKESAPDILPIMMPEEGAVAMPQIELDPVLLTFQLARHFVLLHGGQIQLTQDKEKGLACYLCLPLRSEEGVDAKAEGEEEPSPYLGQVLPLSTTIH